MKRKIAFLINPIAGIGGRVGLKGSDNLLDEALKRGGQEIAKDRASDFLKALDSESLGEINFLTCSGVMGEDIIRKFTENYETVYHLKNKKTSSRDTINACRVFIEMNCDLILFCGGDGTARDVSSAVKNKIPVLGIPSGVKMYSSCFAVTPNAAAKVVEAFVSGKTGVKEAEILDIDEEAYRRDEMNVKLFSHMKTPYLSAYVQDAKSIFVSRDEERIKYEISRFCVEFMRDSSLYILGPGTTTKAVFDLLGIEKTLLGVDAVKDGKLIGSDLNEKEILMLLDKYDKAKIIVSPLGNQGFIFGRGNQQISDKVIRAVGVENIIVIATPHKLMETEKLFVDTGNKKLNKNLSGSIQVVCGYMLAQMKTVVGI